MIGDPSSGLTFTVRQDYLVDRCLEDEQLLNALSPNPLLDSHLLALDENTLKTELINDDIINETVNSTVGNFISSLTQSDAQQYRIETRRHRSQVDEFEDQLCKYYECFFDKR